MISKMKSLLVFLWALLIFKEMRRKRKLMKRLREAIQLHSEAVEVLTRYDANHLMAFGVKFQWQDICKAYETDIVFLAHSLFGGQDVNQVPFTFK